MNSIRKNSQKTIPQVEIKPAGVESVPVPGSVEAATTPMDCKAPTGLRRGPVSAKVDGFVLDEEVWVAGERDDEILEGMSEAFWGSAWADAMDERGDGVGAGVQVIDAMPEVPEGTKVFARKAAQILCAANGVKTLGELLVRAAKADGCDDPGKDFDSFGTYARSFGSDMAMQMMGHGVSWADDHEDFECTVPHVEYGSIEAMGEIADQRLQELRARLEKKSIFDLAELPSPEAIAAGEPLAVGAVVDDSGEDSEDDSPSALEVFLREKLGVEDLLNADQLDVQSLVGYIPTYKMVEDALRKASPLLRDLTLVQDEDDASGETRLVMRKARLAHAEIGDSLGMRRGGDFRVGLVNNWVEADALLKWMAETMEGDGIEEVPVDVELEGWERRKYVYPLRKEDANGVPGQMLLGFLRGAIENDPEDPSLLRRIDFESWGGS